MIETFFGLVIIIGSFLAYTNRVPMKNTRDRS